MPFTARPLPSSPTLEPLKEQARELLNGIRAGDVEALRRFREQQPDFAPLSDEKLRQAAPSFYHAQHVVAREHGFPSWAELHAHVAAAIAASHTRPFVRDVDYYEDRARGLLEMHAGGLPDALRQIRAWHPRFAAATDANIAAAELTLDDARLVYAREHGVEDWSSFTAHVRALAAGTEAEPFMEAFDTIAAHQPAQLRALLARHPELTDLRGTNGNTLLNLAVSLAPRDERPSPEAAWIPRRASDVGDSLAILKLLLDAGADPNIPNARGWTPLHQAAYANRTAAAALLLSARASIDPWAHGDGGTPLAAALFWGHREVADFLAASGVSPRNLRIAAGLGRIDLVRRCFGVDDALTADAIASRGFYRPHSGFPMWRPSDDPQEILDEALVWAAKSDRVEVMPILVSQGASVSADPYRGTPLLWAASNGRAAAARWLIDNGADVNQRATFGGLTHGDGVTALHLAAQNDHLEMAALLIERGADAGVQDRLYRSTPVGWARHSGATRVGELLAAR